MDPLVLNLLSMGVAVLTATSLGFIAYWQDKTNRTNRAFFQFAIIVALWSIANFVAFQIVNPEIQIWAIRAVMLLAVLESAAFFQFVTRITAWHPRSRKFLRTIVVCTILVAVLTMTPYLFNNVYRSPETNLPVVVSAIGVIFFALYVIFILGFGHWLIWRTFKKAVGIEKRQLGLVLIGSALMFILILGLNFFLPAFLKNVTYIPWGPFFTLPMFVLIGYGVLRYRLFNLKLNLSTVLVFFLGIAAYIVTAVGPSSDNLSLRLVILTALAIFGVLTTYYLVKDIREHEQLYVNAGKLKELNRKLSEFDKVRADFMLIVSHQLRSPLTVIKGYTSLLEDGLIDEASGTRREALSKISKTTDTLVRLVGDILNVTRIENGKMQYLFVNVDLIDLLTEIVDMYRIRAHSKKQTLIFKNFCENLPSLSLDPDKMREVINNLLENAIKYSGLKSTILVTLRRIAQDVRVSVTDEGIGFDPGENQMIFKKYGRTKKASLEDPDGLGIGLYLVKHVIDAHKGRVFAESSGLGRGSTFSFELPIRRINQL
jgi:signal transduction histidine kinase